MAREKKKQEKERHTLVGSKKEGQGRERETEE
jgi:hypothetical protein